MTYHMCVIHDTISRLRVIKFNSEEKIDNFYNCEFISCNSKKKVRIANLYPALTFFMFYSVAEIGFHRKIVH